MAKKNTEFSFTNMLKKVRKESKSKTLGDLVNKGASASVIVASGLGAVLGAAIESGSDAGVVTVAKLNPEAKGSKKMLKDYSNNNSVLKIAQSAYKGKYDLTSSTRDRFEIIITSVGGANAIERRIKSLKSDGFKADAKSLKLITKAYTAAVGKENKDLAEIAFDLRLELSVEFIKKFTKRVTKMVTRFDQDQLASFLQVVKNKDEDLFNQLTGN